ncbi:MAG: cytochrome d ubiquinol oxidase subunit II [Chloroflexota bacterium]|nr:cytochrome d ubiquinol oxidase subunit II [Chloroflexota bacterium]
MTAVELTAITLWLGVTAYAVFGGADFGGGFWDLAAGTGREARRARALIVDAIGPVWEANHTWLIFDLVILWTAFSSAFAAIMSTLFVPLSLAAVGIVLRGSAFAFGPLVGGPGGRRLTATVFGLSSIVTPFFLGAAAGAIASGRVPAGETPGDLFASWLNPTSALVGVLAVAVCAYLAAVFLVADARRLRQRDLERYFLRRAMFAAIVAGGLAIAGIGILQVDAPVLAGALIKTGWPFIAASGFLGLAALLLLRLGAPFGTRALAVGAVVAIVWGWGVAQYPDILPGSLSLAEAAAPSGSLEALLVVFIVAALVIAPSLGLLYSLDQRGRLVRHELE